MDGRFESRDRWIGRARSFERRLKEAAATRWIDWTHSPGELILPGSATALATLLLSVVWTIYLVGDLRRPPRYFIPLITAVLFGLILLARRLLETRWRQSFQRPDSPRRAVLMATPLAVLAFGLLMTGHGQSLWPLSATALAIVVMLVWNHSGWSQWTNNIQHWNQTVRTFSAVFKEPSDMTSVLDARPSGHPRIATETAHGLHPIHWMQRTIDSHGAEHLKGVTQVHFESGQSFLTVHIPFCPPFAQTPVFECHPVLGEEIRIRTSVAYPYGARVELKRVGSPQGELSIELEFAAVSNPVRTRAA